MDILREHSSTPGWSCNTSLIFGDGDGAIINEMKLTETTDSKGNHLLVFRGKFQEADAINKNKRSYPYQILDENMKRLEESIKFGSCVGELDHPADSIVHFLNASHKITKLWWEGKVLMGEGAILSTPSGKILKALINDGVKIGISSRGVGNGKVNEEGILVIGESYKLITFDVVNDPSTHNAFQERVVSGKKENYNIFQNNNEKNESSSITKIVPSKELVLACLGGIVNKQIQEQKARLS